MVDAFFVTNDFFNFVVCGVYSLTRLLILALLLRQR